MRLKEEVSELIDVIAKDTQRMIKNVDNIGGIDASRKAHLKNELGEELVLGSLYDAYSALNNANENSTSFFNPLAVALIAYGCMAGELEQGAFTSKLKSAYGKQRLLNDEKQKSKNEVYTHWLTWQQNPTSYKTKVAFANDMLDKFENLESVKVIEKWCRDWKKSQSAS